MPVPHGTKPNSGWNTRNNRYSVNGALGLSLVILALTAIFLTTGMAALLSTAFGGGAGNAEAAAEIDRLIAKHDDAMKVWQDQFNGRSVFFKPPAPPPPAKDTPPLVEIPTPQPAKDPGPDPVYRGPSIAFAYGETVYFSPPSANDRFLRVRVGEESAGVRVLATNLPWYVKVGYKGGEYDVPLFAKTDENLFMTSTPKTVMLSSFLVPVPASDVGIAETDTSASATLSGDVMLPGNPSDRSVRTARRAAAPPPSRVPPNSDDPEGGAAEEDMDDPVIDDDETPGADEEEDVQPDEADVEDEGVDVEEEPETEPGPQAESPAPQAPFAPPAEGEEPGTAR